MNIITCLILVKAEYFIAYFIGVFETMSISGQNKNN
jgi:hypothetical protein